MLRTALAIQYMMEHIEVVIQPHELIVGTAGGPGRYCVLYPETRGGQFPRDLPKILKAEGKAGYAMTQAEVDTVLNEVVPYWRGKTSHELYLNMLPRETRRVIYGDEEYATQGLIFDEANNAHTLSWTGSYEKVIREAWRASSASWRRRRRASRATCCTTRWTRSTIWTPQFSPARP